MTENEQSASERLRVELRAVAEGYDQRSIVTDRCVHGTAPYVICTKCEQRRWTAARELILYDTLDRFSAAIERLADVLDQASG